MIFFFLVLSFENEYWNYSKRFMQFKDLKRSDKEFDQAELISNFKDYNHLFFYHSSFLWRNCWGNTWHGLLYEKLKNDTENNLGKFHVSFSFFNCLFVFFFFIFWKAARFFCSSNMTYPKIDQGKQFWTFQFENFSI